MNSTMNPKDINPRKNEQASLTNCPWKKGKKERNKWHIPVHAREREQVELGDMDLESLGKQSHVPGGPRGYNATSISVSKYSFGRNH